MTAKAIRPPHHRTIFQLLLMILGAVVFAVLGLLLLPYVPGKGLSVFFYVHQDLIILPLILLSCLGLLQLRQRIGAPAEGGNLSRYWPALICLSLLILCWAGRHFILADYDLSRDEQMASFDAWIFRHGQLAWPIAPAWREYLPALNTLFVLEIPGNTAWVSGYLPGNAGLKALLGIFGADSATGAILTAIGAICLWRVAVRRWPNKAGTQLVVLLLYACSAQIILTGMTAYAMNAHLALNLAWLACFERRRPLSDAGAIAIGWLATGLHQPIFHPLFVLPFLVVLLAQREYRRLLIFTAAYALIGIFWLAWPTMISMHFGDQAARLAADHVGVLAVLKQIELPSLHGLWLMTLNLLRLVTWQHLLFLPLLALGIKAVIADKQEHFGQALAAGIFLTLLACFIILPYQGHGWGYRYLHGLLGSACLLGGYGWQWLDRNGFALRRLLVLATAFSLLLLPVRFWMVNRMVMPYVATDRSISQSGADFAVIDNGAAPFVTDLVLNRPDLSNRPIRLTATDLSRGQLAALCRNRRVLFIGVERMQAINGYFGVRPAPTKGYNELRSQALKARCVVAN